MTPIVSYKIIVKTLGKLGGYHVIVISNFLNPKGHHNLISGSKVTAILLKGLILPMGGVASGRICQSF